MERSSIGVTRLNAPFPARLARSRSSRLLPVVVAIVICLAGSQPVHADDGVIEINETCATATGCFEGDGAGYPVTIDGSAGGSYVLTSNLVVPNATTDGIVISSANITVDLAGFEIVRSGCEGAITNCTPTTGSGTGITRTQIAIRGMSIRNGTISGMGFAGVVAGQHADIRNLTVRWSRLGGITADVASVVAGNTAYQNGAIGISASTGSSVVGNVAYLNGGDGIAASGASVLDNTSTSNVGDGIAATFSSNVDRNTVRSNGGFGLDLDDTTAYRNNSVNGIGTDTVDEGVDAGGNVCNGSTTCP